MQGHDPCTTTLRRRSYPQLPHVGPCVNDSLLRRVQSGYQALEQVTLAGVEMPVFMAKATRHSTAASRTVGVASLVALATAGSRTACALDAAGLLQPFTTSCIVMNWIHETCCLVPQACRNAHPVAQRCTCCLSLGCCGLAAALDHILHGEYEKLQKGNAASKTASEGWLQSTTHSKTADARVHVPADPLYILVPDWHACKDC